MKSDISPHCWVKAENAENRGAQSAPVPVNKCVQPSWLLSWPHCLGHECACWTLQLSWSQQLITDKMMKKEMSVCAGVAKLCLLALCPAQVWPHSHSCLVGLHSSLAALLWCGGPQSAVGTSFHPAVTWEQWQFEDVMKQNASCTAEGRCRGTAAALVSFVCYLCCSSLQRPEVGSWRCWPVPLGSRDVHPKSHGNHS